MITNAAEFRVALQDGFGKLPGVFGVLGMRRGHALDPLAMETSVGRWGLSRATLSGLVD